MRISMIPVFLIGGGWRADAFSQTYGPFLEAAGQAGRCRIAIVVAEEPDVDPHQRFLQSRGVFESIGLAPEAAVPLIVSAAAPLTLAALAQAAPSGMLVCGGLTPAYYDALCLDRGWCDYLHSQQIAYAGFSAGAMIAAAQAIIGGWQRAIDGRVIAIADEGVGEDIDLLDIRPGLGLVPFAVDVHASQAGTLTRLLHSVDQGAADAGWAIDEDTMLASVDGQLRVFGHGSAYRVQRHDGHLTADIFQAGAVE
jgi:cyanophycinase